LGHFHAAADTLKPFDDIHNFENSYLQKGKAAQERFKKVIKDKTPEQMKDIAHTYPALRSIFSKLQ